MTCFIIEHNTLNTLIETPDIIEAQIETPDTLNAQIEATGFQQEFIIYNGITTHSALTLDDGTNPHATTKTDVSLGNVSDDAQLKIASNLSDVADQQTALNNVTDVSSGTNEHILTKDTASGDAIWKAATAVVTNHSALTLDDGTNPHSTTKTDVSLGNVSNDAQLKIASNLSDVAVQQTALNNVTAVSGGTNEHVLTKDTTTGNATWKASVGGVTTHSALTLDDGTNPHSTTKTDVGLANVSNDAQLKIASNLSDVAVQQTALNNVTAVSGGTNEHVLTKDTSTGNAIWKVAAGGGGGVNADTEENILASTPTETAIYYATDTNQTFLYSTDNSSWYQISSILNTSVEAPDMGWNQLSNRAGYGQEYISDKKLAYCKFTSSAAEDENAFRVSDYSFQIYLNGEWQNLAVGVRFREDENGLFEVEHKPVGLTVWIEIYSGNSDIVGLNGKRLVQQYTISMGAFPGTTTISGGTF